jgi:ankyrin repeat protein
MCLTGDYFMLFNKQSLTATAAATFIACFVLMFGSFCCVAEIQTESAFSSQMLLQNAIKAGQLDDVRILLEQGGIDVNQPFDQGITPLHSAVINNQENIAAVLIQNGAKIDVQDASTKATPLHLAALYGRENIANLLIKKGADVNAVMKFGITPLLVASQFKHAQIVQLLLENKTNINHADDEGFTALHFVAQNGDPVIAEMLVEHKADLNLLDKTHKSTPLAIANQNNHSDIAQMLQKHGAQ